jgi:outer membrane receptor protein involved in Fe transport
VVAQFDGYTNELNGAYDHRWLTPGLFVSGERDLLGVTWSASFRGDRHPDAGLQVTERVAALVRPAEGWSVRLSGGTGFAPATAVTEETEAIGLRRIRAGADLDAERSFGVTLDIGGKVGPVDLLLTGYRSEIRDAVQLADAGDASGDGVLRNAAGPTRIGGIEFASIWRFGGGKLFITYGYADGSRSDAMDGSREPVPLISDHRFGVDLMLEKEGVYRYGIEAIVHGIQHLDDDPYRAESKPYVYTMALAMRRFGPWEVVANFENLFDVRQTDFDPLVRPTPMTGGRWTNDVWAPLEGFMANMAVRYRW